jgi:hypothetical protein
MAHLGGYPKVKAPPPGHVSWLPVPAKAQIPDNPWPRLRQEAKAAPPQKARPPFKAAPQHLTAHYSHDSVGIHAFQHAVAAFPPSSGPPSGTAVLPAVAPKLAAVPKVLQPCPEPAGPVSPACAPADSLELKLFLIRCHLQTVMALVAEVELMTQPPQYFHV